ncbi:conserved protein of unknown function [Candidatus Promineifilum breve]|uniref:DUF5615 domain-containing protein n=1 Tax=Candidatus Promineifilum breve TaxID=1806508 RepID=A0A160SZS1_9CHLR|nr:DUF5615 family PIN-like protein [Candidatus Promineifilum breve]CUS02664.2 conserved protein of unknown function [Candidatus Promineifilum breve]
MKFLADENFNNRIIRGLLRRMDSLDLVRVQDLAIAAAADPTVLAWAAAEERVLLTHDKRTMPYYALSRIDKGELLTGVIVVDPELAIGGVIDDLLIIATCSTADDWVGRIEYLPL